jgi:hypothetical protein
MIPAGILRLWAFAGVLLTSLFIPAAVLAGNIVDCPVQSDHPAIAKAQIAVNGGLVLYPSPAAFEDVVGDELAQESFDSGAVSQPGDGIGDCVEPVSASSDDHCFAPGDLIEGFSLTSTSGGGYVVLGDNHSQVGQEGLAVGPMEIITSEFSNIATIVSFSAEDVTAVAMDVIPGCNGLSVNVQVFDRQDGLIGSTTISVDASWNSGFLGFVSPSPVGRIELATSPSGGQLIQNLRFGPHLDWLFHDRFEAP